MNPRALALAPDASDAGTDSALGVLLCLQSSPASGEGKLVLERWTRSSQANFFSWGSTPADGWSPSRLPEKLSSPDIATAFELLPRSTQRFAPGWSFVVSTGTSNPGLAVIY